MILNKKLIVIMPAYNAEKTLYQTYSELPHDYVDEVVLVDDASGDRTSPSSRTWPLGSSSLNIIQDSAHSLVRCWRRCRSGKTPTILFLTARCWFKQFTLASKSGN